MALWKPTRRELIKAAPLALGAASIPKITWAATSEVCLRFMVLGDWGRRGKHRQVPVAETMQHTFANRGARFVVTTGDNFYNFGVKDKQASHWRESFTGVYKDLTWRIPWFPVLGNHDYTGNPEALLGTYDGTLWWMPARNYIIKGSLIGFPFVDLFMVDVTMWEGGNDFPQVVVSRKPGKGTLEDVRRWLAEQLAQSSAPIKLVFGHHGIYSVGSHGGLWKHAELEEVLKNGGASAYVHGHDHCLYHIRDAHLDYICSGGGSKLDGPNDYHGGAASGCVLPEQCPKITDTIYAQPPRGSPVYHYYERSAGFVYFEVTRTKIQFRFIGPDLKESYGTEVPIRSVPTLASIDRAAAIVPS
jgi:hypothetical protein